MEDVTSLEKQLSKWIFPSIRVMTQLSKPEKSKPEKELKEHLLRRQALFYVYSGQGLLNVNGKEHCYRKNDIGMLPKGSRISGISTSQTPVSYILILFSAYKLVRDSQGLRIEPDHFPLPIKHGNPSYAPLSKLFENLVTETQSGDELSVKHIWSELLLALLYSETASGEDMSNSNSITDILGYMQTHYHEELSVHKLAQMAGFSVNYFTKQFKQFTKMTPSSYLTGLRMAKAKQLLFSQKSAKQVAQEVGYKDEHYFSRKFKKSTGIAPTFYIKNKCEKIATLYYGLDDYLITLDCTPVAALSYADRVSKFQPEPSLQRAHSYQLDSLQLDFSELERIKPDLILTSSRFEPELPVPMSWNTVCLPYNNNNHRLTLTDLAQVLGKEDVAKRWLELYEQQRFNIRQQMRQRWGNPTAYFLRILSNSYRIYGQLNQTGSFLYEELNYTLPEQFPSDQWAIDLQLEDISQMQAQHLFIMVDPTQQAKDRFNKLINSEQWTTLYQNKQVQTYDANDLMFKTLGPTGKLASMQQLSVRWANH